MQQVAHETEISHNPPKHRFTADRKNLIPLSRVTLKYVMFSFSKI